MLCKYIVLTYYVQLPKCNIIIQKLDVAAITYAVFYVNYIKLKREALKLELEFNFLQKGDIEKLVCI